MTFDVCSPTAGSPELQTVVRELAAVAQRLDELVATARTLSGRTDWQAYAARAFHDRADRWAGAVSALQCPLEIARLEAREARDRAALMAGACP